MLSKSIGTFIAKLFVFGLGYWVIDIVVDVLSSILIYEAPLRTVAIMIWTIIPGLYLIKSAFVLLHEAQEAIE